MDTIRFSGPWPIVQLLGWQFLEEGATNLRCVVFASRNAAILLYPLSEEEQSTRTRYNTLKKMASRHGIEYKAMNGANEKYSLPFTLNMLTAIQTKPNQTITQLLPHQQQKQKQTTNNNTPTPPLLTRQSSLRPTLYQASPNTRWTAVIDTSDLLVATTLYNAGIEVRAFHLAHAPVTYVRVSRDFRRRVLVPRGFICRVTNGVPTHEQDISISALCYKKQKDSSSEAS